MILLSLSAPKYQLLFTFIVQSIFEISCFGWFPCILAFIFQVIHLGFQDFNAGTISSTDIRYMLLHELQHYKHKDILIGYLINTVHVFYWFNPLIWYFLKRNTAGTRTCLRQCCITIIERNRIQVIWKYTD